MSNSVIKIKAVPEVVSGRCDGCYFQYVPSGRARAILDGKSVTCSVMECVVNSEIYVPDDEPAPAPAPSPAPAPADPVPAPAQETGAKFDGGKRRLLQGPLHSQQLGRAPGATGDAMTPIIELYTPEIPEENPCSRCALVGGRNGKLGTGQLGHPTGSVVTCHTAPPCGMEGYFVDVTPKPAPAPSPAPSPAPAPAHADPVLAPAQGTGAKFDGGKRQWTLLTRGCARALGAVVDVLGFGAKKYSADSWQQVPNARVRYHDALLRHLDAIARNGFTARDPETGLLEWAHVACNALFLCTFAVLDSEWGHNE